MLTNKNKKNGYKFCAKINKLQQNQRYSITGQISSANYLWDTKSYQKKVPKSLTTQQHDSAKIRKKFQAKFKICSKQLKF